MPKDWTGLFPKKPLDELFSPKVGSSFLMDIEIAQEEGIRSRVVIILKGTNKSTIKGELEDILEETDSDNRSIVFSLEENNQTPKEIYLVLPENKADKEKH
ncbi:hypothetical protein OVS_02495 [Mycoplasma ovis str. Michigan]|uniref:Uncharacterized protein n=1 Tax=Mycoplasma ovis str. Michigan TaxID=1415773 RepID=A0ABN4BR80_9MOLU|nr:hypothetical protein [Mycoplasma ovis]AHC40337.1 hypothetical protein OVS_02495 [Mycoplasma ovis str. Michigan]